MIVIITIVIIMSNNVFTYLFLFEDVKVSL